MSAWQRASHSSSAQRMLKGAAAWKKVSICAGSRPPTLGPATLRAATLAPPTLPPPTLGPATLVPAILGPAKLVPATGPVAAAGCVAAAIWVGATVGVALVEVAIAIAVAVAIAMAVAVGVAEGGEVAVPVEAVDVLLSVCAASGSGTASTPSGGPCAEVYARGCLNSGPARGCVLSGGRKCEKCATSVAACMALSALKMQPVSPFRCR